MSIKLRYLYRAYRYRYRVDPAELRFLCSRLKAGQTAVDIGCHKGAYTYWMRRRVGPGGRVVAFEPQPRQVAYLQSVFSAMGYDNVTTVPMAVSDTVGQMRLHFPENSTHAATLENRIGQRGAKSGAVVDVGRLDSLVEVTTLDAFFANQPHGPDFLKIDVEGHESAVLRGARKTLEEFRPAILIECEARHRTDGDARPVLEYLTSLGYEGSFFCRGRRLPLSQFNPALHQHLSDDSKKLPRNYVNNFAFEPT